MKRLARFVGNYFNQNPQPGEERTGEAVLEINLDNNIATLWVNGTPSNEWKLSPLKGSGE